MPTSRRGWRAPCDGDRRPGSALLAARDLHQRGHRDDGGSGMTDTTLSSPAPALPDELTQVLAGGSGAAYAERYTGALMNTFGPPQRVLVRGEGCYVWDADGNRYLDLLAGIAVNALGHAHPLVQAAVSAQLATLGHVSNFFASPPQIALAEKLTALL